MKTLIALCLLMTPLASCALGPKSIDPVIACPPPLPDPPESVVDALDAAARTDPKAGGWIISLAKHYQDQDACLAARR
jgi:hypothetical protein